MAQLLTQAVNTRVGPDALATLAAGDASVEVTTFKDGKETGGSNAAIPPLLFLALFYALIILLAGQMFSSTLGEKENRVTEMILTTVKPTTLISGKVLALFGIGLVQLLIFALPLVISAAYTPEMAMDPFRADSSPPELLKAHEEGPARYSAGPSSIAATWKTSN